MGRFFTSRSRYASLLFGPIVIACAAPGDIPSPKSRLLVAITSNNIGSREAPLKLSISAPTTVTVRIESRKSTGELDTSFNGYVRLLSKPGSVENLFGDDVWRRNVKVVNGVADNVRVQFVGAYGETQLWAEDIGYAPAPITRDPPPQCADGLDNNGDGNFDFPNDPGCAFANDDTEALGTFMSGVSNPIFFQSPRIADVRGVEQGGAATPYPHEQLIVDVGWRRDTQTYAFQTVVTRIASDGFYISDIGDPRGFSSIFAFTFVAPPRLRVCDRLRTLTGSASDFYGFTELGFPTWTVEYWDPDNGPCPVPEPFVFTFDELLDSNNRIRFRQESALVRVQASAEMGLRITKHFGRGYPAAPTYIPTDDASNCDFNRDGKVDYSTEPEMTCANNCNADIECTEYAGFSLRGSFNLVVTDELGNARASTPVNASSASGFEPLAKRGAAIGSFTGTLRYFSGGSRFTIEARCEDDVVSDPKGVPMPSTKACVRPRTPLEKTEETL